jgi:hypothetical protein
MKDAFTVIGLNSQFVKVFVESVHGFGCAKNMPFVLSLCGRDIMQNNFRHYYNYLANVLYFTSTSFFLSFFLSSFILHIIGRIRVLYNYLLIFLQFNCSFTTSVSYCLIRLFTFTVVAI